jgi:hypothetical protein
MWYSMYVPTKKDESHHQITVFLQNCDLSLLPHDTAVMFK